MHYMAAIFQLSLKVLVLETWERFWGIWRLNPGVVHVDVILEDCRGVWVTWILNLSGKATGCHVGDVADLDVLLEDRGIWRAT